MGLCYGSSGLADEKFGQRHMLTAMSRLDSCKKHMYLSGPAVPCFQIDEILGDCTACTVVLEYTPKKDFEKVFKILHEYMSMNARISCFFSKKIYRSEIEGWIEEFKKFPVVGLHLQKSNREPEKDTYMLSGILKVSSPIITDYTKWDKEYPEGHNNNDLEKINELNAKFGLQTL